MEPKSSSLPRSDTDASGSAEVGPNVSQHDGLKLVLLIAVVGMPVIVTAYLYLVDVPASPAVILGLLFARWWFPLVTRISESWKGHPPTGTRDEDADDR